MCEACAELGGAEALGASGESWLHAAIARVITVAAAQRFTDSSWIGWMTRVQLRCQGDGGQFCGRNVDRARQVGRDSHEMLRPNTKAGEQCSPAFALTYCPFVTPGRGATTSVPNKPCCSPPGPAVKKRVFVGPLAAGPLPKLSAQRPAMASGPPSAESSGPRCVNSPLPSKVAGSKACTRPSPKLPTSRSLLNAPKSAGASASPHGELRLSRDATRRDRVPLVAKAVTKPGPSPAPSSCASASCKA